MKGKIWVLKNATCTSHKSIQEIVTIPSKVIENRILKESNHMAIMFNENNDFTITEQLVIHCQYIVKKILVSYSCIF